MKDFAKYVVYGTIFLVPVLALVVTTQLFFPYITGKSLAFYTLVEIMTAAWVMWLCYEPAVRPRWSYVIGSFGVFLLTLLAASFNAKNPLVAFWSNFERMDGWVTLAHVFLLFVVMSSVLRGNQKLWGYFLNLSLAVAAFVALKGIADTDLAAGRRIDGTLGNAAYMAVYMLFHIFYSLLLLVRTKVRWQQIIYGFLILLFTYTLLQTGTRGTVLGLATGGFATVGYLALLARNNPAHRRIAAGAVLFVLVIFGGFYSLRHQSFIQESPNLARVANINLSNDLAIRGIIWRIAGEGVAERPVLGWGMGNFNYVFDTHYNPDLYAQETWFDRTHNFVFDWLIAGGVTALVTYLVLLGSIFYYLVVQPLRRRDVGLNVFERAVLFGLLVGYITHNLVVFDNLISYIFLAIFLALLHGTVTKEVRLLPGKVLPVEYGRWLVLPGVVLLLLFSFQQVVYQPYQTANELVLALRVKSPEAQLDHFANALSYNTFANQEVVEQMLQKAKAFMTPEVGAEMRAQYIEQTDRALDDLLQRVPDNARINYLATSYYLDTGRPEIAKDFADEARRLSPRKFNMALLQGVTALENNDIVSARKYFTEAYDFNHDNFYAAPYYVGILLASGEVVEAEDFYQQATGKIKEELMISNYVLQTAVRAGSEMIALDIMQHLIKSDPNNLQHQLQLVGLYDQFRHRDQAIQSLENIISQHPDLATDLQCPLTNLKNDRELEEGCNQ